MPLLTAIWVAALALSLVALAWMSTLIGLRAFEQSRTRRRAADRHKVEAALVGVLQGREAARDDLRPYCARARLMAETLLEFVGVVRGGDRERVLQVLADLGVPATLRRRLGRGSLAGQLACIDALPLFASPETQAALAAQAAHGAARRRIAALRGLARLQSLELGAVLSQLEDGRLRPSPVVGELVRRVVAADPSKAADALRIGAGRPSVQVLLIDSLASAGDYAVLPLLIELSAAPSAEIRAATLKALGALSHPAAERVVHAGFADPDWRVRAAAAEAAAGVQAPALVEDLAGCLSDPTWRVRFVAATVLTRFGAGGRERLTQAASGPVAAASETAAMVMAEQGLAR